VSPCDVVGSVAEKKPEPRETDTGIVDRLGLHRCPARITDQPAHRRCIASQLCRDRPRSPPRDMQRDDLVRSTHAPKVKQ